MNRGTINNSAPAVVPNISPAVSPKSSPTVPPKEDEFPDKFKQDMRPGLRKMFGGKEPAKK